MNTQSHHIAQLFDRYLSAFAHQKLDSRSEFLAVQCRIYDDDLVGAQNYANNLISKFKLLVKNLRKFHSQLIRVNRGKLMFKNLTVLVVNNKTCQLNPEFKTLQKNQFLALKLALQNMLLAKTRLTDKIVQLQSSNQEFKILELDEYAIYLGKKEIYKRLAAERNQIKSMRKNADRMICTFNAGDPNA